MLSAIDLLVGRPFAEALGWALVHSLWQDALVAALAAVALATLCRTAADVRYVVASLALTLMLALPAVTAWTTFAALAPGASLAAQTAEAGGPPAPALEAPVPAGGAMASIATPAPGARLHRWFSVVVLTWLAGVFVLSLRLLAGWLIVQRLRLRAASPAPAALGAALARLIRRLHLRRPIALRLSGAVDVPTVIGWLKPILLLPASALAGLSPEHLEAILAHELAHVRRHDYLVNLLQSVVETLLFYHPAVWWISRRVRIEREHCCDDLAVSLCGDPVRYAHALAALERWRGERPALALAASGGSLVARIRRLLGAPAAHDGRAPIWVAGIGAVALLLVVAARIVGAAVTTADVAPRLPESPVVATVRQTGVPVFATTVPEAPVVVPGESQRAAAEALRRAWVRVATADEAGRAAEEARRRAEGEVARANQRLLMLQRANADRAAEAVAFERARAERALREARAAYARAREQSDAAAAEQAVELATLARAREQAEAAARASAHDVAIAAVGARQGESRISTTNNGRRLDVRYDGRFELTDDDRDIKSLSPGGYLIVSEGPWWWFASTRLEVRADSTGKLERKFWTAGREHPYEPEGREWLATNLVRLVRTSGFAADTRAARILNARGPQGLLDEIAQLENDYVRRLYFEKLLRPGPLDPAVLQKAFVLAGQQIRSDYEMSRVLQEAGRTQSLADDHVQAAYFDAAAHISSDYEQARVLMALVERGPLADPLVARVIEAATRIDSDYEASRVLRAVVDRYPVSGPARAAFFRAVDGISSDYERGRVLAAAAEPGDAPADLTAGLLQSARAMGSDYEVAKFLINVAARQGIDGPIATDYFKAASSIGSDYERRRVLAAVGSKPGLSQGTLIELLQSAAGIKSDYELATLLITVAETHRLEGPARDAYLSAAEHVGSSHETGRIMTALVKSEKTK